MLKNVFKSMLKHKGWFRCIVLTARTLIIDSDEGTLGVKLGKLQTNKQNDRTRSRVGSRGQNSWHAKKIRHKKSTGLEFIKLYINPLSLDALTDWQMNVW